MGSKRSAVNGARLSIFAALGCSVVLLSGCPKPAEVNEKPAKPLEGLKLRLAVVDDPAMAEAIVRLRGEWLAQTGAELDVAKLSEKDLAKAKELPADAVLCASHLLGDLAERDLLAPVPPSIVREAEWGNIFELLRLREAAWGSKIMAVPFGSPVLTCYYRADLLDKLGRRPPKNWVDYQDVAKLLAEKPKDATGAWAAALEPLAPGWAGLTLLARAATYAKHRDNYSTLFNIDTMEPMISSPAYVHALDALIATTKLSAGKPQQYDPAAVRAAFWRGECGMALTWPTAADRTIAAAKGQFRVGFIELPGSRRVYNHGVGVWDLRSDDEDLRVPLLAIAGRIGVVGAKASNTKAAFQLLLWLSDSQMSAQVSAASPATTMFRKSNLTSPGAWVEKAVPALAAVQYGDATEAALRHEQWLGALRIPGRAEYLAALDEAVTLAIRGDKSSLDALLQADKKWREITARLGVDRQRAAYRHSLGLEK